MGRRLPWRTSEPNTPVNIENNQTPFSSKPKPKTPSSLATPSRLIRGAQHSSPSRFRTPSTSPPPEPPKEEFMIPSDDKFRIVEDELLHIAQLFTAHLHRAEYNRQKSLARSTNAAAIKRFTVGPGSRVSKQRDYAAATAARQRSFLSSSSGSCDAEPEPESSRPIATGLRTLLESPRKEARMIRSYPLSSKSGTRAAAGFSGRIKRREEILDLENVAETDDDDGGNDLDTRVRQRESTEARSRTWEVNHQSRTANSVQRVRSAPDLKRSAQSTTTVVKVLDDDDDDDDPFGIKRRRIRRAQSKEQMSRSTEKPQRKDSPDVIPSFL